MTGGKKQRNAGSKTVAIQNARFVFYKGSCWKSILPTGSGDSIFPQEHRTRNCSRTSRLVLPGHTTFHREDIVCSPTDFVCFLLALLAKLSRRAAFEFSSL